MEDYHSEGCFTKLMESGAEVQKGGQYLLHEGCTFGFHPAIVREFGRRALGGQKTFRASSPLPLLADG